MYDDLDGMARSYVWWYCGESRLLTYMLVIPGARGEGSSWALWYCYTGCLLSYPGKSETCPSIRKA